MERRPLTVRFETVGCRLNQYETERMASDLAPLGLKRVGAGEPADLYIINTCTVTHRADKDSRYLARRARRDNPGAKVVLVGCYVETDPDRVMELEGVDAIIRNDEKGKIARLLPLRLPELNLFAAKSEVRASLDYQQRNRACIKISDGCNQTCTFCLVRLVRGRLQCRPADEIIAEVNELVAAGFREVTVTGVNIGYYRGDYQGKQLESFAALCSAILENTDLYRLRLSSIEPQAVTHELLQFAADNEKRVCRHWHLPLQSGSDRLLRLMQRPYTPEIYLDRVRAIKEAIPGSIIGGDLIAGFPSETEADFAESCRVIESGYLDYLHVFSYSDRPGTAAAALPDKISPQTISDRVDRLKAISNSLLRAAYVASRGKVLEVICESRRGPDGSHFAVADNYLHVRMPRDIDGGRRIYRVLVTQVHDDHAECEVIG